MLVEERRQRVLDLVSQRGFVSLADLAQLVRVSESAIRRDLDYWHQQGSVRRTHGGAIYVADGAALPALAKGASGEPIHWDCSTAEGSAGYQTSVMRACVFASRQS